MSYHNRVIKKGVYGHFSKVMEEADEVLESQEQGNLIMELVELSDMYGAIEGYIEFKFGMKMNDLKAMSDATKLAFKSGYRK